MTLYEKELQALKPYDEVQETYTHKNLKGYNFIMTAGHGYLIVPKNDNNYKKALSICAYGYKGKNAIYLEEDCELSEFLNSI